MRVRIVARKHRAPKGALRLDIDSARLFKLVVVRKHRAPKGTLRLTGNENLISNLEIRQKAPSAIRCIKTAGTRRRPTAPPD